MGKLDGKVAFITGAARGQGRSHAVRLAEEWADIIACDIGEQIEGLGYPLGTSEDLAETVRQVEALDRGILAQAADVRSLDQLQRVVGAGVSRFGRLDIVVANAGVMRPNALLDVSEVEWEEGISINLTGAWKTVMAAAPVIIEQGEGGSIVLINSTLGLSALPNCVAYTTAKHGMVGLMRTAALELGPHRIRVNTVHPTTVDTRMVQNEGTYGVFSPELEHPTREDLAAKTEPRHVLPIPWIESIDISNAIAWLVSDDARYVTGTTLQIDAGKLLK
jgi:SDR family mycofactocin-dependent oxidoreductase